MTTAARPLDLRKLFDAASEPLLAIDAAGNLAFCNAAAARLLGAMPVDLLGRPARNFGLDPPPQLQATLACSIRVKLPDPEGGSFDCRATFVQLGATTSEPGRLERASPGLSEPLVTLCVLGPLDETASPTPATAPPLDSGALHAELRAWRAAHREAFTLARLAGNSPAIMRVRQQVALAAASGAAVLIVGPPGSGREHLARAIHHASDPAGAARLVVLDCNLLSHEALRERLGVLAQGPGRIAQTATPLGTLVLCNVDRALPEVQFELETLIGERRLPWRVMGTAASAASVGGGAATIRPALALRLSTITIELPSISERLTDVPLLAQAALEECNAEGTKRLAGFAPAALERLILYDWPGQLDELWTTVREAHVQAAGPHVEPGDLPARVTLPAAARRPARREAPVGMDEFLVEIEKELLQRALHQARGNKAKAARLLGLTRPRLYRRLVQLGLEPGGATDADARLPACDDAGRQE